MKIYTKTGDDGSTGLLNGQRVQKYAPRVEVYGTSDELNSIIGLARYNCQYEPLKSHLEIISNKLFVLGSDLAAPLDPAPKFETPRITQNDIDFLEKAIDEYTSQLESLKDFILPGGGHTASVLHIARTVCRRAERLAVNLCQYEDLGNMVIVFLNRLSDYLFTAARMANHLENIQDKKWNKDL